MSKKTRWVLRDLVVTSALTCGMLLVSGAAGYARFGSLSAALAAARGERVHVPEKTKVLGNVISGSQSTVSWQVTNVSSNPIGLIGSLTSCTCTSLDKLPPVLQPRESAVIKATILIPKVGRSMSGSIKLFTDEPSQREVILSYSGRLVPAS
jgi:hypothetical protein